MADMRAVFYAVMTEGIRPIQEASIITCSWVIESQASGKLVASVSLLKHSGHCMRADQLQWALDTHLRVLPCINASPYVVTAWRSALQYNGKLPEQAMSLRAPVTKHLTISAAMHIYGLKEACPLHAIALFLHKSQLPAVTLSNGMQVKPPCTT